MPNEKCEFHDDHVVALEHGVVKLTDTVNQLRLDVAAFGRPTRAEENAHAIVSLQADNNAHKAALQSLCASVDAMRTQLNELTKSDLVQGVRIKQGSYWAVLIGTVLLTAFLSQVANRFLPPPPAQSTHQNQP